MENESIIEERWAETRDTRTWQPKIVAALNIGDFLAIAITIIVAHVVSFGWRDANVLGRAEATLDYSATGIIIGILWFISLEIANSRNIRYLGQGNDEYRLVIKATTYFFCAVAIFSYVTTIDFARAYILIAYPLGLALLLITRWCLRRYLVHWRNKGRALTRVMVVSDEISGAHLYDTLHGARQSGLNPVAL